MIATLIARLWPLSSCFEYSAELGAGLRMHHGDWWEAFSAELEPGELSLAQARCYEFLRFCEQAIARDRLEPAILSVLTDAAPKLRAELEAEALCRERSYSPRTDPEPEPLLAGQAAVLYAPEDCRGYPGEIGARLDRWIARALDGAELTRAQSTPASNHQLTRVHERAYTEGLIALAQQGGGWIGPETAVLPDSVGAIRASAGALIGASKDAVAEPGPLRLCQVRPGSHHAERGRGGGTCLVNNLAVAAADALAGGLRRVAIIDIDAHHGNGTEQIFAEDPRVLCVSLHQAAPYFPSTGARSYSGRGRGKGSVINRPIDPGAGPERWLAEFESALAGVRRHRPELVLVELGPDAHRADPVSELSLSDRDYAQAFRMIESLEKPTVFELGASLAERSMVGALRSLVAGWSRR